MAAYNITYINATAGTWGIQRKNLGNLVMASTEHFLPKFLPGLLCPTGKQAANY